MAGLKLMRRLGAIICVAVLSCLGISPTFSGNESRNEGAGTVIRDCDEPACPELIVIPGADKPITLGSPASEAGRIDNEVQHQRTIRGFAIGKTEVTVAQYRACVDAGGCRPPEWLEPGGEHNIETGRGLYYKNLGSAVTDANAPIVGVSFADAIAFSAWISQKTGKSYRLPSEAEWEYAARAGTSTAYWWGDEPNMPDGAARANCRGCGDGDRKLAPEPVTTHAPNPWGLFNVHGNVWEWAADFYCEDQSTGPTDGTARATDDCPQRDAKNLRVFRGGSAFYGPEKMRSASRLRNFPDFRNFSVGFRVARDL